MPGLKYVSAAEWKAYIVKKHKKLIRIGALVEWLLQWDAGRCESVHVYRKYEEHLSEAERMRGDGLIRVVWKDSDGVQQVIVRDVNCIERGLMSIAKERKRARIAGSDLGSLAGIGIAGRTRCLVRLPDETPAMYPAGRGINVDDPYGGQRPADGEPDEGAPRPRSNRKWKRPFTPRRGY